MKKLFIILIVCGLPLSTYASTYKYYRAVTVTSTTSIASGTNANFPFLFSGTYNWLEASTSGGFVQNLCTAPNGNQEPCDFVFATSSANCGKSNLNFETETYTSSTGLIDDWVNVPSLSAGTTITACYDNSSITTDQSHPSSTWNSHYQAVYHFPTVSTSTLGLNDSTANAYTATRTVGGYAPTPTAPGQIDGSAYFQNAGSSYLSLGAPSKNMLAGAGLITFEGWVNTPDQTAGDWISSYDGPSNYGAVIELNRGSSIPQAGYVYTLMRTGLSTNNDLSAYTTASTTISNGSWHYLVTTFNLASNTVGIYVDGANQPVTYTKQAATSTMSAFQQSVFVAALDDSGSPDTYLETSTLDETRISTGIVSTPSWILSEYNNQASPSTFYAVGNQQSTSHPFDGVMVCSE